MKQTANQSACNMVIKKTNNDIKWCPLIYDYLAHLTKKLVKSWNGWGVNIDSPCNILHDYIFGIVIILFKYPSSAK
jgi:hypothetical protein